MPPMDKRAKEVVVRTAITNLEIQRDSVARLLTGKRGDGRLNCAIEKMQAAEDAMREWAAKNDVPIRPMKT